MGVILGEAGVEQVSFDLVKISSTAEVCIFVTIWYT